MVSAKPFTKRKQCSGRSWSPEEDKRLLRAVASFEGEELKFSKISASMRGCNRTYKQCRERWHNHLKPGIVKGNWTDAEDVFLFDQVCKIGRKWACIARMMRGRTDGDVKNRFNVRFGREKHKIDELSDIDDFINGLLPDELAELPAAVETRAGGFYVSVMSPERQQDVRAHVHGAKKSACFNLCGPASLLCDETLSPPRPQRRLSAPALKVDEGVVRSL